MNRIASVFAAVVLLGLVCGVAQANLLLNSGFDAGGTQYGGWNTDCDVTNWYGWGATVSDVGWGVSPQAGAHATMLSTWTGGGDAGIEQKPLVTAGTAYNASLYYAIESVSYTGRLGGFFSWKDAGGAELSKDTFTVNYSGYTPSNWVQFTAFSAGGVTAPVSAVRCEIQFNGQVGGSTTYIDTFNFAAIPEPTTAALFGFIGLGLLALRRLKR